MILRNARPYYFNGSTRLSGEIFFPDSKLINRELVSDVFKGQLSNNSEQALVVNPMIQYNSSSPFSVLIKDNKVEIRANDQKDIATAIATLKGLAEAEGPDTHNQMIITKPLYPHREFMLDVARHYFPISEIKKIVDELFRNRINYLHLHLSDDQGFRMESIYHPELNVGEFYTQKELQELIEYSKIRGIEIIPEIDIPGHMTAILDTKPSLRCNPYSKSNSMCLGSKEGLNIILDLLTEVADLFPGEYVHIGCDETNFIDQKKCPHCKEQMLRSGLSNINQLFASYINQLNRWLKAMGKTTIVWNDALKAGQLDDDIIVQKWFDFAFDNSTNKAYENGRKIVVGSTTDTYYDYPFSLIPLAKTYSFQPRVKNDLMIGDNILGVSSHIWTENISTNEELEKHIFPRVQAFGEMAFVREGDYNDFLNRLSLELKLLEKRGIKFTSIADATNPNLSEIINYIKAKINMPRYGKVDNLSLVKLMLDLAKNNLDIHKLITNHAKGV